MNNTVFSLFLLGLMSSTPGYLPFWMTTNQYGLIPENSGSLLIVKASNTQPISNHSQLQLGTSIAANHYDNIITPETPNSHLMIDELYGSLYWKNCVFDVGSKHRELSFMGSSKELGSLSVSGGHFVESGNARTIPGIQISLTPIPLPFASNHLWVYGGYGDFMTTDTRYVNNALIHRTKLGLQYRGSNSRFVFDFLLDHYAVWGGKSPEFGAMALSFNNYLRVVTGSHASSMGTESDQINVIGDQGGSELFRFSYFGNGWKLVFQHDIPYNDGSGMGFQNFPDGINTLCLSFNNKELLISDVLLEYHYTMFQSGPINGYIVNSAGERVFKEGLSHTGQDQYFWNGQYKSCWTHYGRIIGNPMILPSGVHSQQWTTAKMNIGTENDRYKAIHLGLSGRFFHHHPYKVMITYSKNYGSYNKSYVGDNPAGKEWGTVKESSLNQLSCEFSGSVNYPSLARGLSLVYGLFCDKGELYRDSFGFSIGFRVSI